MRHGVIGERKRKAEEEAAVARKKVEEDVARLVEEHWKDSSIRMSLVRCGTSNKCMFGVFFHQNDIRIWMILQAG